MGRYIQWDDVIDRYPEINTLGGSDEVSSTYIVYAESFVDSILKSHWTPPFSDNNMVVKDLTIDWTYFRAARFKLENAIDVKMIDETGAEIPGVNAGGAVYSNTQSYSTSFGMDDPINWEIDEDQIDDEATKRA
jgi:hypothetical protein